MEDAAAKELATHLAEYTALRGEITQYNQRIDRTVGVYLTALVGLAGYLLRPDSTFDLQIYIESVISSSTQASLMLILGILNGLLFLRLQSFFLAVLAMSQYTATVIRPRVAELLATNGVLQWDGPDIVRAKRYWLPSRSASQFGFGVVALLLSIAAACLGAPQVMDSVILGALLAVLVGILAYALYTTVRIVKVGRHFLEMPACQSNSNALDGKGVLANRDQSSKIEVAHNKPVQATGEDASG